MLFGPHGFGVQGLSASEGDVGIASEICYSELVIKFLHRKCIAEGSVRN